MAHTPGTHRGRGVGTGKGASLPNDAREENRGGEAAKMAGVPGETMEKLWKNYGKIWGIFPQDHGVFVGEVQPSKNGGNTMAT